MVRLVQELRKTRALAALLIVAAAALNAQQAAPAREPASKAAAILTWSPAKRERYISALDSFFLTRTVKAGPHAHVLARGRPLAAFERGGSRADYFDRFLTSQRVRGVLVLQDGKIRLERYVPPDSPATRWNSFSVAKSITSTLVGAAMKDGYIHSLDDSVTRYIKELRGSAYDAVNIRQLLTMTSGVKWNEDYTDMNSDVARMYALPPDPGFDMTTSYVRRLPREAPPGTKWVYKTSETNLVGVLVADATGKKLADYLSQKIWRAYGMERDAEWMIDDVGDEQGGCCLAVTLRDYARFGQFILDGARINGKSIVADHWLAQATRTQVSIGAGTGYGYQWWTRDDGTFEARGIYGQTVHIDRARRLVIVINSATEQPTGRAAGEARQEFIATVTAEVDSGKPQSPPVPNRIASLGLSSEERRQIVAAVARSAFDVPDSWDAELSAVRVDLGASPGIVLRGTKLLCGGTGNCQLFVMRNTKGAWVSLFADEQAPLADSFELGPGVTHGIKDLTITTNSSAERGERVTYRFDRRIYRRAAR